MPLLGGPEACFCVIHTQKKTKLQYAYSRPAFLGHTRNPDAKTSHIFEAFTNRYEAVVLLVWKNAK